MIPLRDINPRSTLPFMTVLIILANLGAFLYQVSLGARGRPCGHRRC